MNLEGEGVEGWGERSRRVNIIGDSTVASIDTTGAEEAEPSTASVETQLRVCGLMVELMQIG